MGTPGINQLTRGTYSTGGVPYFLWDRRATMGCKCDAGYFGADCSLRRCKYGVDPLFLNTGTPMYETFEIGVWSDVAATTAADAGYAAMWDMTFYDVFGEDYTVYDMKAGMLRDNTGSAVYGRTGDTPAYRTTCSEISALFPNEMLGDTSSTVSFCTYAGASDCDEGSAAELGICTNADYIQTANDDATPTIAAAAMADNVFIATDAGGSTTDYHKWSFQYGKGNPGFIKDAKIRNLRDARNDMEQTIGEAASSIFSQANTWKTPTFYMKKTADGEWSDYTTSSTFDFFLPGYLKAAINSGQDLYFSENLDRYLTSSTTDTQKSNMINGVHSGGTQDMTLESSGGILGAYTFGLTPLDFPRTGAASGWNTYQYGSRLDVGATNYGAVLGMEEALLQANNVYKTKLQTNYEYVTMCSNRGSCDTDSGVCNCFSGYTNDNCDTQTAII